MLMKRVFLVLVLVAAAVVALYIAQPRPSHAAGEGAVEGRVTMNVAVPAPEQITVTRQQDICGARQTRQIFVVSEKNHGLRDVVITLAGAPDGELFTMEARLEQRGCRYEPHVQVVPKGSSLRIVNLDPTLHNVHAYALGEDDEKSTLFNVAQVNNTPTAEKTISLDTPGVFEFDCDVHPWMRSFVVVSENGFYASTGEDGYYRIDGIPEGRYTMQVWHEGLGSFTQEVTIAGGEIATVDFPIEDEE